MSETLLSRIERGKLPRVTLEQVASACAAVGLKFVARAYPDADPVRDAGHARLLERLRAVLHKLAVWRTEVPLPIPGDLRAWDGQIRLAGAVIGIEAEMRLADVQALERRIALKQRDGGVDRVILLVADTRGNRRVLALHREALRARFPLDTRAVLAALREGDVPAANGIVVL
jgi:hypothetical protein